MRWDAAIISWGYAVEVLLTGGVYGGLVLFVGGDRLVAVMADHWQIFSTIAGALFAGGIAALLYLAQALDSEFGRYLHWRKADTHYLRAYQVQTILFLVAGGVPIGAGLDDYVGVAHVAWCVILYACINGATVVRNTVELVRLRQKFRSESEGASSEMEKEPE